MRKKEISWCAVVVLAAATRIVAQGTTHDSHPIQVLAPLIETSAQRLELANQVALAKWDSGAAVEDPLREEQVISNAVKSGADRGLNETALVGFFKSQIEANKLVQYRLLAEWHRAGRAPKHMPVDLRTTVRPQLDRLQTELISELANAAAARSSLSCGRDVAAAVGRFVHAHHVGKLLDVALDRALAGACVSSTVPASGN